MLRSAAGDTSDYRLSITFESRRKQATAIVMMGVLGAEFGQEMGGGGGPGGGVEERKHQQHVVKGFGITDYSHARHTSEFVFLLNDFCPCLVVTTISILSVSKICFAFKLPIVD